MEQKFFICEHCGNIIAMIRDCGVSVSCCGEKMQAIQPGTTEAAGEKHIPVYHVEGKTVTVRAGEIAHPMNPDHYIPWICLETTKGVHFRELTPEDVPEAQFVLDESEEVRAAYAFCNQHSLWKR